MTWAKFDDRYDDNRKIKRVWRENRGAIGLHAMAITYCTRHETDGLIDEEWIIERLPTKTERHKILAVLVHHGLFEPTSKGYRVHDFLDYQASHASRSGMREAGRKAALKGWANRKPKGTGAADPNEIPTGIRSADPSEDPNTEENQTETTKDPPTPLRGVFPSDDPIVGTAPRRPAGNRGRDAKQWREQMAVWGEQHFPEAAPNAVSGAVAWLTPRVGDPVTADDLRDLAASSEVWADSLGLADSNGGSA